MMQTMSWFHHDDNDDHILKTFCKFILCLYVVLNYAYSSLHHLRPVIPHGGDKAEDVHFVWVSGGLEDRVHGYDHSCSPRSRTADQIQKTCHMQIYSLIIKQSIHQALLLLCTISSAWSIESMTMIPPDLYARSRTEDRIHKDCHMQQIYLHVNNNILWDLSGTITAFYSLKCVKYRVDGYDHSCSRHFHTEELIHKNVTYMHQMYLWWFTAFVLRHASVKHTQRCFFLQFYLTI